MRDGHGGDLPTSLSQAINSDFMLCSSIFMLFSRPSSLPVALEDVIMKDLAAAFGVLGL